MRRTENNVCKIINALCPYLLACDECDVHRSYDRAYKRSMEVNPNQKVVYIEDAHTKK